VPERDPSWTPDGTRLIYAARTSPSGPFRLFLAKADGSGRVQLTAQAAGVADRSPVVSPDGTRIAFVSDRDGGFPELYLMDLNGSGVSRLTDNAFVDGNPSWTPDGARLVFERCCANGTSDLVSIDVATRVETSLTATTTHQEFDPVVSPDGTRVAYVAFEVGVGNVDVWVMNADGSSPTRLTQDAAPDLSPDWQPLPVCTLRGSGAIDDLRGTDGNDVLCALGGDDLVRGGLGHDLILGGKGADVLEGQDGPDLIFGEGGDDTLGGGAGYDVLDGAGGTDTCVRGADGAFRRLCEL
jgi:Tol biopolymer transport system component